MSTNCRSAKEESYSIAEASSTPFSAAGRTPLVSLRTRAFRSPSTPVARTKREQYPYVYADCVANTGGPQTSAEWFNTAAFVDPSPYRFGTCGRDIVRGPGSWNLDAALMKDFTLPIRWETLKLQFRADAFNVLNHPNLGLPNNTTDSTSFGTITSASDPRVMELGLSLRF
jgi:hypothetical protein